MLVFIRRGVVAGVFHGDVDAISCRERERKREQQLMLGTSWDGTELGMGPNTESLLTVSISMYWKQIMSLHCGI